MQCITTYQSLSINQNRLEHEVIPFMHIRVRYSIWLLSWAIITDTYNYADVISLNMTEETDWDQLIICINIEISNMTCIFACYGQCTHRLVSNQGCWTFDLLKVSLLIHTQCMTHKTKDQYVCVTWLMSVSSVTFQIGMMQLQIFIIIFL